MNPWAEPFERNFNEHSEQALMSIKNSFQTTTLDMDSIPWEKANQRLGKTASLWKKENTWITFRPSGRRFKEHRAARWMRRMKRIFIAMWTVGKSCGFGHT